MTKIVVMMGCLMLATAGSVAADEFFSLKAGYQILKPQGEFAAEAGGVGTKIDMEDDLDMENSENLVAEAALSWGDFRLSGNYLPMSFEGDGSLERTLVFNGTSFTAGTDVDSEADIDFYDVGLAWFVVNIDDAPVRFQVGPEVAVKVVDADLQIRATAGGLDESESLTAPVPTVGGRARIGLADWAGIIGRVGWIGYDGDQFLDVDLQVELSPIPMVGLFAGYRYFDLEIDQDDVFIDVRFSGPYAGAMVRF